MSTNLYDLLDSINAASLKVHAAYDLAKSRGIDIGIELKLSDMSVELDDMASDIQDRIKRHAPDLNPSFSIEQDYRKGEF